MHKTDKCSTCEYGEFRRIPKDGQKESEVPYFCVITNKDIDKNIDKCFLTIEDYKKLDHWKKVDEASELLKDIYYCVGDICSGDVVIMKHSWVKNKEFFKRFKIHTIKGLKDFEKTVEKLRKELGR